MPELGSLSGNIGWQTLRIKWLAPNDGLIRRSHSGRLPAGCRQKSSGHFKCAISACTKTYQYLATRQHISPEFVTNSFSFFILSQVCDNFFVTI